MEKSTKKDHDEKKIKDLNKWTDILFMTQKTHYC